MLWKIIGNRYGALAIGTLLLILVFSPAGSGTTAECGGTAMRPGDRCEETRNGSSHTYSYDEEQHSQSTARYGFMALGALLVLGGTTSIIVRAVRKNRPATPAAPTV